MRPLRLCLFVFLVTTCGITTQAHADVTVLEARGNTAQCAALGRWVSAMNDLAGQDIHGDRVQHQKFMKKALPAFSDQVFRPHFGKVYAALSDRDKRKITGIIEKCKGSVTTSYFMEVPFRTGRWAKGGDAQGWANAIATDSNKAHEQTVSANNSPTVFIRTHPPVNAAGKPLLQQPKFTISTLSQSVFDNPLETCSDYSFSVSVEFNLAAAHVFTRQYIHQTLFKSLLPNLRRLHCPNAAHQIAAHISYRDFPLRSDGRVTTREQAASDGLSSKPFVYATVTKRAGVSLDASQPEDLSLSWIDDTRVVLGQSQPIRNMADLIKYYADADAERQDKIDRARMAQANYDKWLEKELQASDWRFGTNWMLMLFLNGEGYATTPPPPNATLKINRNSLPMSKFMIFAYVELGSELCQAQTPNGARLIQWELSFSDNRPTQEAEVYVDQLLHDDYKYERRLHGGYGALNILGMHELKQELRPLFSKWQCGGREHARFTRGLAKYVQTMRSYNDR